MSDTTVVRNAAWVIAWDAGRQSHVYLTDADVAFAGDRVTHVGKGFVGEAAVEIDGRALMVMPGLVNIHAHPSSEPLNKGLIDELGSPGLYMSSLYEYMPLFRPDHEGSIAAAEMALCELVLSGVTTVADLSIDRDGWLDLLGRSGLRVCVAPMYRDARWFTRNGHLVEYEWDEKAGREAMDGALRTIERARQHPSGRLFGMVAPAQVDTCSEGMLRDSIAVARERNLSLTLHAAQSVVEFHEMTRRHGKTPVQWLDGLGVLGPQTVLGHAIFLDHHSWLHWPTRSDLGRLAETGTTVAHCPTVFSRRGIRLEHFGSYVEAGVNMGIGTDTFPHNMLEEMRGAAIVARMTAGRAQATSMTDVFTAATVGGAQALGRDDIGRLAPGMKADLVLVDLAHPMMRPLREPLRNLVYVAADRAVKDVYVDGLKVVGDGRVLTMNLAGAAGLVEEAQARAMARAPGIDYAARPVDVVAPMAFSRG